jgi:hypothetical protein
MKRFFTNRIKVLSKYVPINNAFTRYCGWSTLSTALVSVENVIATHSMLNCLHTTTSIDTEPYFRKDILGQLGGLAYIAKKSKSVDENPKKFLHVSLLVQQLAIIAESATPLISKELFVPITSIASVGKNISMIGLGAINAQVIQKISDNNIGELYAKISIFNTLGSTVGMMAGLFIVAKIPSHEVRFCLVPFITAFRVWTYKKAISGIYD